MSSDPTSTKAISLSVAQERLWVLEQLQPRHAVQNVARGVRIRRHLHPTALEQALREVVERHKILRTELHSADGIPTQVVQASSPPNVVFVQLQKVMEPERNLELRRLAQRELQNPFELCDRPLLRATCFELSNLEFAVLVVCHRIICDEYSLSVLLSELYSTYDARVRESSPPLPRVPLQYSEIAIVDTAESNAQLSYWQEKLRDAPATLDLPCDRQRPAVQTFRAAKKTMRFDEAAWTRLRALIEREAGDVFSTLLAVFNVLLFRYSRQADIIVGTPVSGRRVPEVENVVGPLAGFVALRTEMSGDPTFAELLARLRDVAQEAFANQDVPFASVLKQLHLERDMSRHPVFQILFAVRDCTSTAAPGTDAGWLEVENPYDQFDLSLDVAIASNGMEASFIYSSDIFEDATVERMMGHFRILLEFAAANREHKISQMRLLNDAERHQLLVEWNNTGFPYSRQTPLHHFMEEQAERTPTAVAVVFGLQKLTYSELNIRANQLARSLQKNGVGAEITVGVCLARSPELLVAVLAVLKAGGAYVPLDPEYPKDRLAAILADSKAQVLITDEKSSRVLPPHTVPVIRLDTDWKQIASEPPHNPESVVSASNLAYVLFTSGSTGRPKGVALEHRSASIFIQWAKDVFSKEELAGTLFSTSVCFDLSVFEMFVPLSVGGKVIIAQNALELPKLPSAREVTLINTVPSAIAELVRSGGVPSSVQVVNLAGEALPTSLAQQIYERTNVHKVYNLYGPTEDTTYSTYTLVPRGGEVNIGRPLPHTQVYLLDENLQPVPIGIPGEIYLSGEGLARGYFGRDDLTRDRFVPNPFSSRSGGRMYRTGDLGRFLPDGNLQYLGRADNQVKLRGFRIELGEIESVLARHPSVQSAVVAVREDIPGDKYIVSYVVPSGSSISPSELKRWAGEHLPKYMVPTAFVEMEQLPLTPNGKIDRRRLPAPERISSSRTELLQPRDEVETMLLRIWEKVLGVSNIGVRDDFFELGGHSLSAARVLAEAGQMTGKDLPLSVLFRGATVESLAHFIRQHGKSEEPLLLKIQDGDDRRLPFFAIVPPGEESLGYAMLARHMGANQTVYKVQGHSPVLNDLRPYTKEEMQNLTAQYIAAIRSVQPHGPYCLGGLCDGTHIAEQMILRLEMQGEEIGLFAIFDTWVAQHSQVRWLWYLDYYRQRLQQMAKMNWKQRLGAYKRVAQNKVKILAGQKASRTDWKQCYWPENFTIPRFRAPVILFKRPKQPFYYINDREMGWGKRSQSGVEVHEIEFHHLEILREPHVRQFGEALARSIDRVTRSLGRRVFEDQNAALPSAR